MKFSLIIPVYNSENTLQKLVDTILEQTYTDYEVILVDDGSTDNSFSLMEEFQKKDKRIKIFTKKNEGPGLTRKYGCQKSQGDLLFFIDSDDWLYNKNVLEEIANIYNKNNFEVLFFNYIRIFNNTKKVNNAFNNNKLKTGRYDADIKSDYGGALWQKIFVRKKMKEEYFYNSSNFEDVYTTYMYLNNCKSFYYTQKIFYVANRDTPGSLTKNKTTRMKIDTLDIIEKLYKNTKFKKIMAQYRFNNYCWGWRMITRLNKLLPEEKEYLRKLKSIKDTVKNDIDFKKIKLESKIKYYITNFVIKAGRCIKVKKNSITQNYIYNVVYQIIIIILPIITTPYISRVLGAEGVGIYGYVNSIVTYFTLIGTLGLINYGKREIAYVQNDKEKRDKVFSEIFLFRAITTSIVIIIYILTLCITNEYKLYYQILILELMAMAFDISWFFQGIEDFKKVVIRNSIVKLVSICLMFILVKTPEDLWIYFTIYAVSTLLGNITFWLKIKKYVTVKKVKLQELKKHIKPTISLFIPQIAVSLYTVLNKTILGSLTNNMAEVGFYEQSQKIVKIALTLVTTIGVVMIPRIANIYANGDKQKIKEYMKKTFNFVWFAAIPIMFGIMAISQDLVPWFFGQGYEKVAILLILSSPIIMFISLSTVTGSQLLLSIKKQNVHTIIVFIGAGINILLNILLVNKYAAIGSIISTVIAEFVIATIEIIYVVYHKYVDISDIFTGMFKYLFVGIIMLIGVWILQDKLISSITSTIIEIMVGGIIYIGLLLIIRDKFLYKYVINKFILKRKKEIL